MHLILNFGERNVELRRNSVLKQMNVQLILRNVCLRNVGMNTIKQIVKFALYLLVIVKNIAMHDQNDFVCFLFIT